MSAPHRPGGKPAELDPGELAQRVLTSGPVIGGILRDEARLDEVQGLTQMGSWELDLRTGSLDWSAEIFRIFELDPSTFGASYEAFLATVHPEDRAAVNAAYTRSVATGEPYEITHRLLMPDGRIKHVQERGRTYYGEGGEPLRSVGTVQDITQLRQATEALKSARDHLEATLEQKNLLLRELNHRVKNSLQVISSLLYLQGRRAQDPAVRSMLDDTQLRIRAMAMVHELLSEAPGIHVDFATYLRRMTEALLSSHAVRKDGVRIVVDAREAALSVDAAVPCGLIVNELVTNALKHAFPGDREGVVRITFGRDVSGAWVLSVEDDGVGLPEVPSPGIEDHLGLQLVRALATQLRSEPRVSRDGGTRYELTFRD